MGEGEVLSEGAGRRARNEAAILKGLNDEQVRAVVAAGKTTLVVAAAGSGKTKVLTSRVLHQIYCEGRPADTILAVTFSREATREIRQRLARALGVVVSQGAGRTNPGSPADAVTVTTFHGLAYRILRQDGAKVFDERFHILSDGASFDGNRTASESPAELARQVLTKLCEDSATLKLVVRLLEDYFDAEPSPTQRHRPPADHRTRRYYRTYQGEWVRSKSERDIANFLFTSNIVYEYERPLVVDGITIHPDFYLPEADLYIEHWGDIDESYAASKERRRALYRGLRLVETSEQEMADLGALEARLRREFEPFLKRPVPSPRLSDLEARFKEYRPAVRQLVNLLLEVYAKMKADQKTLDEIVPAARRDPHEVVRIFYTIAIPFLTSYQRLLTDRSYVDHDDLIILANQVLEEDSGVREKYRRLFQQILVDEYQDVNLQQVRLIKNLLGPDSSLFCVGDDWQAIYGWRGSDVRFIVEFGLHFPDYATHVLSLNYRSHGRIVEVSNSLIAHNSYKIEKQPQAHKADGPPVVVQRARTTADGVDYVVRTVKRLHSEGYQPADILLLYRKRADLLPYSEALASAGLRVTAKTMHASKGLEAEQVFVIGLHGGAWGFPSVREDSRILQLIRPSDLKLRMEEERRLFYVALTRSLQGLHLITSATNPSPFIQELDLDTDPQANLPEFPNVQDLAPIVRPPEEVTARERETYRRLLGWRKQKAAVERRPEPTIATDQVLWDLARRRPATQEELRAVPGVGEGRATKYGEEWLSLLRGDDSAGSVTTVVEGPAGAQPQDEPAPVGAFGRFLRWLTLESDDRRYDPPAEPTTRVRNPPPPNAGRAWSAAQEADLVQAWLAGETVENIAWRHGRTPGGIQARLRYLTFDPSQHAGKRERDSWDPVEGRPRRR